MSRVLMDGTTEARLIDLETRYTHLQRQFEELSDVVTQQQKAIEGLAKSLADARELLAALSSGQTNERPPHY